MLLAPFPFLPSNWEPHESVLRPMSDQARQVHGLWEFMLWISVAVYAIVIVAMLYAFVHGRRTAHAVERGAADEDQEARNHAMGSWVRWATSLTVLTLFVFLVYDFGVGRAIAIPVSDPQAIHIHLTGHQWWWEVHYEDTVAHRQLTTANEIHVPVGRPVIFRLTSTDVIHSFWMPNLNGKKDLIPGHENFLWFRADTPGVYRGQCAEYCGLQHAKMALVVVAQPAADYDQWYYLQLRPAATPSDSVRAAGEQVFLAGPCALCHNINGTAAGARFGPDLTHIGSRLMIASGTLPNTTGNLAGWVVDPQRIKPGAKMPPNALAPSDLHALLAYLEGLK